MTATSCTVCKALQAAHDDIVRDGCYPEAQQLVRLYGTHLYQVHGVLVVIDDAPPRRYAANAQLDEEFIP